MLRAEADYVIAEEPEPVPQLAMLEEAAMCAADALNAHIEIEIYAGSEKNGGSSTSTTYSIAFQKQVVAQALDFCLKEFPEDEDRIESYREKLEELADYDDADDAEPATGGPIAALDRVITDINAKLLVSARETPDRWIGVAILVLTLTSGEQRIITHADNFSDSEGEAHMKELKGEIIAANLLKPDERLDVVIRRYPL